MRDLVRVLAPSKAKSSEGRSCSYLEPWRPALQLQLVGTGLPVTFY